MKLKLFVTVVGILLLSCPIIAKEIVHSKWIDLGKVLNETTVVGIIKGHDTVHYKVKAKAHQSLHVNIESNKVYFNIFKPNKGSMDGGMFMGKIDGKNFTGKLSKSGVYTIAVYLTDDEAQKDQKLIYTIDIGLE